MPTLRSSKTPAFAPFLVALVLIVTLLLAPSTGFGPQSNTYAACALLAVAAGLIIGVLGLLFNKTMHLGWRLLIGLLYMPTVLASMILAGF